MPYKMRAKCPHREVAATRSRTRSRSPETKWKIRLQQTFEYPDTLSLETGVWQQSFSARLEPGTCGLPACLIPLEHCTTRS
jgi:hypothetical protein